MGKEADEEYYTAYSGLVDNRNRREMPEFIFPFDEKIRKAREDMEAALNSGESWMLPGTGFSVKSQMEHLFNLIEVPSLSIEDFYERVNQWIQDTVLDIRAFQLEYLTSDRYVYPFSLEHRDDKIICPDYGAVPYNAIINENEREGAVKQAVDQVIEFIKKGERNSLCFFSSPPGWSGLKTDQGHEIIFPATYTYFYFIDADGAITSCAVQTNMNLADNEKFLEIFGEKINEISESEKDKIKKIVQSVIKLEGTSIENVVGIIQSICKDDDFSSIYQDLNHLDLLMDFDREAQKIISDFLLRIETLFKRVNLGEISFYEIAHCLGDTILSIALPFFNKETRHPFPLDWYESAVESNEVLCYLQLKGGCNGGGLSSVDLVGVSSAGVSRLGKINTSESLSESLPCPKIKCKQCGWEAKESDFNSNGELKYSECPQCGWKP